MFQVDKGIYDILKRTKKQVGVLLIPVLFLDSPDFLFKFFIWELFFKSFYKSLQLFLPCFWWSELQVWINWKKGKIFVLVKKYFYLLYLLKIIFMTDKKYASAWSFKHRLKGSTCSKFKLLFLHFWKYFLYNSIMFVCISHYDSFLAIGKSWHLIFFYSVYILKIYLFFYLLFFLKGFRVFCEERFLTTRIIIKVTFSLLRKKFLQNKSVYFLFFYFHWNEVITKFIQLELRITACSIILYTIWNVRVYRQNFNPENVHSFVLFPPILLLFFFGFKNFIKNRNGTEL